MRTHLRGLVGKKKDLGGQTTTPKNNNSDVEKLSRSSHCILRSSSLSRSSSNPATCFWNSFRTTGLTGSGGGTAGVTPRECLTTVFNFLPLPPLPPQLLEEETSLSSLSLLLLQPPSPSSSSSSSTTATDQTPSKARTNPGSSSENTSDRCSGGGEGDEPESGEAEAEEEAEERLDSPSSTPSSILKDPPKSRNFQLQCCSIAEGSKGAERKGDEEVEAGAAAAGAAEEEIFPSSFLWSLSGPSTLLSLTLPKIEAAPS